MEEFEVDDLELLEFLYQFDDVSLGQTDAGFRLLRGLELPLQFQKFLIHGFERRRRRRVWTSGGGDRCLCLLGGITEEMRCSVLLLGTSFVISPKFMDSSVIR